MKTFTAFIIGAFLLGGCSNTVINGAWKDPQFKGGLNNILVVGIAKDQLMQRLYEDSFVQALGKYGAKGTASYTVIQDQQAKNSEAIRQQVRDKGFAYILITRVVDKKTIDIQHPATTTINSNYDRSRNSYYSNSYYRHWNDYYDRSFTTITTMPAYTSQADVVILETNIYDASSEEIIYSVQTDTIMDSTADTTIKDVIGAIVDNLKENKLI